MKIQHREPAWATTNTWDTPDWTVDELVAAKAGRTVSVVLPALNEERTVAEVVASIRPLLGTLVDELIVLDSGSTDATAQRARAAGAEVISREQAVPELEPVGGKGEVLWRSLAVTSGDLVAFVDSDLIDPDPAFVPKLLGPLLTVDDVQLAKAYYRRPLRQGGAVDAHGGGRVTELVARPLLAALRPSCRRCCSRWAANMRALAICSPRCRSRRATAWRSGCCSTPMTGSACPRSGRSTWAFARIETGRWPTWV